MIKKLSLLVLFCLLISFPVLSAPSAIHDDAGLFSQEETAALSEEIQRLQEQTQMDYAIVTTRDAKGKTARSYADDFYEAQGYGVGEEHSGMLYLIDLDNQEIYISTEGQMLHHLTDDRIESLLDDAFTHAAEEHYADSAYSVLQGVGDYLAQDAPKNHFPLALLIGSIAGLIASLSTFFAVKSRYSLTHETYHYPLHEKSTLHLTVSEDRLIHQTLTHRKIPKDPPSSPSSSHNHTTTHHSSSGRTHGGGGRRLS